MGDGQQGSDTNPSSLKGFPNRSSVWFVLHVTVRGDSSKVRLNISNSTDLVSIEEHFLTKIKRMNHLTKGDNDVVHHPHHQCFARLYIRLTLCLYSSFPNNLR